MSHQHEVAKLYTDEESKSTIGQHQLPIPMGWKILIQPNQIKQQTKGGILLPTKAKENEAYLTAHGQVAKYLISLKLAIRLPMESMLVKN